MKMVTEDLVNSKEDGVSAEEAIDVKEKKKEEKTHVLLQQNLEVENE